MINKLYDLCHAYTKLTFDTHKLNFSILYNDMIQKIAHKENLRYQYIFKGLAINNISFTYTIKSTSKLVREYLICMTN